MKLSATLLSSRVGQRLFWSLLLAAAVPIVVFGWLAHWGLSDSAAFHEQRRISEATKYAGLRLLDRLLMGRATLELIAAGDRVDSGSEDPAGRTVFAAIAVIDGSGRPVLGDAELGRAWWRDRQPTAPPMVGRSQLSWQAYRADAAQVRLAIAPKDQAGRIWIAALSPSYLWSDHAEESLAIDICVFDRRGQTLSCKPDQLAAAQARRDGNEPGDQRSSGLWNIFLRAEFGVDDWTVVALGETPTLLPGELPLARMAVLAALATLLMVSLLSLTQVRRTLKPLGLLTAGTRSLARRDYSARVDFKRDDEFGELAQSFNGMAERVGAQIEALRVQSAIDREILTGLDVPRVMQQVLQRLATVLPAARTAIVELEVDTPGFCRLHRPDAPVLAWQGSWPAPAAQPDADPAQPVAAELPVLLARLIESAPGCLWLDVHGRGQLLGALLILGPWSADADVRREVIELRDRIAVTLAAAQRERDLMRRAVHDSLTGLLNRRGLIDTLDAAMSADTGRADVSSFTLMYVDLDRFKEVNDSMGHQVGDELLVNVAQRMRTRVDAPMALARTGGDEFVVVLPGSAEQAAQAAHTLCQVMAKPFALNGQQCLIGASIGLARYPADGRTTAELMRRADMAMYVAKARGRSRYAWFELQMDEQQAQRARLARDLVDALGRGEMELVYQPRVNVASGRMRSAEALLRWNHPKHGQIPPTQFIEILEETGAIAPVGDWVLWQACAQLVHWRRVGLPLRTIAVNVSARQLRDGRFAEHVRATLAATGLGRGDLELELTESVLMGDLDAVVPMLQSLREQGVRIAIDDFGTGYSSLSYLRRLPVDVIKVDRSFVKDIEHNDDALKLTRAIVAMARALDKHVVAEGIETVGQAEILIKLGCHELQGYLYAKPVKPSALEPFGHSRFEPATAI